MDLVSSGSISAIGQAMYTSHDGDRVVSFDRTSSGSKPRAFRLDFNEAYNPFCAYNPNYVCPMAPRENWLDIKIEAGEKLYRQH